MTDETVGIIGLGIMGGPMACNLIAAGRKVVAFDRDSEALDRTVRDGAAPAASARDVAERCDIVILMVPDTPHVADVLFGPSGAAEGLSPGKMVVDMSSVSPQATVDFAERINALGCDYLDAPVSGGAGKAVSGELTVMVGGPRAAFERAMPVFEAMATTITLIGERNGDGQVCKVANQIIVGVTVTAVAEALLYASRAGADPKAVRQALMGGAAGSMILENHGRRMLDRSFEPSFPAELQRKDLSFAIEAARDLGLYLPEAAAAWQLFNATIARGDGRADHIAVLKTLEAASGHELKAAP